MHSKISCFELLHFPNWDLDNIVTNLHLQYLPYRYIYWAKLHFSSGRGISWYCCHTLWCYLNGNSRSLETWMQHQCMPELTEFHACGWLEGGSMHGWKDCTTTAWLCNLDNIDYYHLYCSVYSTLQNKRSLTFITLKMWSQNFSSF